MIDAVLGVFEAPTQLPGGSIVQCPICGDHSPPQWQELETRLIDGWKQELPGGKRTRGASVALDWMRCANEDCEQLIIRVHERRVTGTARRVGDGSSTPIVTTDSWIACPRFGESERPIDPLVPEPFRTDYAEAVAILDTSHRMSAVLARRILGDLLKRYAKRNEKRLTGQIDAFTAEAGHPSKLTSNLHHFREVADFAAHTQEDQDAPEPTVIDVDRDEAEWTLELVDRLFDYFIVQPAKDDRIKARVEEKGRRAGRKPLGGSEES